MLTVQQVNNANCGEDNENNPEKKLYYFDKSFSSIVTRKQFALNLNVLLQ